VVDPQPAHLRGARKRYKEVGGVRWSDTASTGVPLLANTPSRAGTAR
jgi:hypothetical protein